MSFAFETHVLPLLQEMSSDPLSDHYPILDRAQHLGIVDSRRKAERLMELMAADGYIRFEGQQNGSGSWVVVYDVQPTAKALKQLDLWPADNERVVQLLQRMAGAMDQLAEEVERSGAEPERAGRLRSGAKCIRDVITDAGTDIAAKVIANLATGG